MATNVDPVTGTSSSSATQAVAARERLGQKDFLQLMMTQFQNQDPFKPLDPSQFLGQLAQFSTVSGINGMQDSLTSLVDSFKSQQMLSGASLVGRDALVPSGKGTLQAGGTVRGAIDVPADQQQVVVEIRDAAGQLVRRMAVSTDTGLADFSWDGLRQDGTAAAPGTYSFGAIGVSGGKASSLDVLMSDRIGSVTLDQSTQALVLNTATQGTVPLTKVRRIS
jgi:flagellar basal-body rod modification protein FlgD